jgi:hypothetical protein
MVPFPGQYKRLIFAFSLSLLLNGRGLTAQTWAPAGGITVDNAVTTLSSIPENVREPLRKYVVAWEVTGLAENDPAVVDCKNALRALGVECGFKTELLSVIRDLQLKAMQMGDPKAFLAAEDQYGWKALVALNVTAEEKFNTYLGAPITNLTIGVNCQGLRGDPLSKFEITRSVKGKAKLAAIQEVLRDRKDAMAAKVYGDVCMKTGVKK